MTLNWENQEQSDTEELLFYIDTRWVCFDTTRLWSASSLNKLSHDRKSIFIDHNISRSAQIK